MSSRKNKLRESQYISPIEEIIDDARNGHMFILADDNDQDSEGDLVIPAQMATPDAINFMTRHGRGLVCLSLTAERAEMLGLHRISQRNYAYNSTAYAVSIEAREGVTTGISAADRARTISVAINASTGADDIVTPGHIFPLVARRGGVLMRAGHTEAVTDIARLAGLNPSGVTCEIIRDDGVMARMDDLLTLAQRHKLKVGTISDLIAYRRRYDHLVECIAEAQLDSIYGGVWCAKTYINKVDYAEHFVLQKGFVDPARPTLVRVHALSLLTDLYGEKGDKTGQLRRSMEVVSEAGNGIVIVIDDKQRDGLSQLMKRRNEAETTEIRDYGIGAQILVDLGVHDMVLLTSSPHRNIVGLAGYDLTVVGKRLLD